jgi:hypothetical protein
MATQFDFASLGNLFGGGGGVPTGLDALLTEDQRKLLGRNAALSAAGALLQASGRSAVPISMGQALGSALQAGQQGYQQARASSFQDLLLGEKLKEAQDARTRQASMSKLFPQVFQQTTTPAKEIYGEDVMGQRMGEGVTPASTQLRIDPNKLQALAMLSKNPLESLGQIAKLVPDLRRAGFTGAGAAEINPFSVFTSDETIPANIRNVAQQYANSYAAGTLDPEKVDDRTKQLADMAQRAQQFGETKQEQAANRDRMAAQFKQSQDALELFRSQGLQNSKEARALAANIADQSLELRKQAEANKPEQFSYAQKKEFDTVQRNLQSARDAEDSALIADRAASLIPKAFGSKGEAFVKGALNAITPLSFDAKDANDKLVQYGQQLALKTPKFSGPTSDADAKRYDTAVGDLANPSKSATSKTQALKDIKDLAAKQKDYAQQQENYYFANNKSLRGFVYTESNPFGK